MALPFGLGCAVSVGLYKLQNQPNVSFGSFILFLGVALSITAFPVLARILAELKLLKTRVGGITMAAGLVNDCTAWVLLALVVALLNSNEGLEALYVFLTAIGFTLFLILAIGPLYRRLCIYTRYEQGPSPLLMTVTLIIVLLSAFVTDIIGIHAIFGGFLAGIIIPHEHDLPIKITEKIEDMINIIFLPLYFTLSGLKTQIGLLDTGAVWGYVVLVIFLACVGKIVGCTLAAKWCGLKFRESLTVGFLMNCKGLVELIVLNIGHDAGVLNDQVFAILVVMALITTFMTTPMVVYLYPEWYQKQTVHFEDVSRSSIGKEEEKSIYVGRYSILAFLDRVESLSSIMAFAQLFKANKVDFHALRLIELTQRTSDVMKIKTEPERDPILKALSTFCSLVGLPLHTHLEYAQEQVKSLSDYAQQVEADLVILPYIPEEASEMFHQAFATIQHCPVGVFVDRGFGVTQHATPQQMVVVWEETNPAPLQFALKLQSFHDCRLLVLGTHVGSQWATRESIQRFIEGKEGDLFMSQTQTNVESKHVKQLTAHTILNSTLFSHQDIIVLGRSYLDNLPTENILSPLATQLLKGNASLLVVQ
ncbi:Sodium/hydrogen exchanger family-domain-containing protein [Sporodiniella umbellata]|nr:Sodium/hydrogen exchanger family-domain-containing protein [Sporodiniella umbellata]